MSNESLTTQELDRGILPRSQNRILTDNGMVDRETFAEPVTPQTEEPTPPATEPPKEGEEQSLEDKLNALLDGHEAEKPKETETTTDEVKPPDFEAPEFQAFNDQFKQYMGVDLKTAYEQYAEMTKALSQFQQQTELNTAQQAAQSLQKDWGVNDAEFNRRTEAVMKYADTLPPDLKSQFDSVEGIKLLWARLDKQKAPSAKGGATGTRSASAPQQFKKSELFAMMQNDPAKYTSLQGAIKNAYETGNVIDDL